MPDFRLVYLVTYRVIATGDNHAAQRVMNDLAADFPNARFELQSVIVSASQLIPGATTYDVAVAASGVVTAASVSASLTEATPPATLSPSGAVRQSSVLGASVNLLVPGSLFT